MEENVGLVAAASAGFSVAAEDTGPLKPNPGTGSLDAGFTAAAAGSDCCCGAFVDTEEMDGTGAKLNCGATRAAGLLIASNSFAAFLRPSAAILDGRRLSPAAFSTLPLVTAGPSSFFQVRDSGRLRSSSTAEVMLPNVSRMRFATTAEAPPSL